MKSSRLQNIKLIAFDFDGTIADTSKGILDSHRYALHAMHSEIPSEAQLRNVIGGNLLKTYIEVFGFSEENAKEAVRLYRKRYAEFGIYEAVMYPGFTDMLHCLKSNGFKVGVATLKAEIFVKPMLEGLGIATYFDVVCGMDLNDSMDKAGLIQKCIAQCNCNKKEAVFVGDSNNDWFGAQKAKVEFIGVTYGFGFKQSEKYNFKTIHSPLELLSLIFENK